MVNNAIQFHGIYDHTFRDNYINILTYFEPWFISKLESYQWSHQLFEKYQLSISYNIEKLSRLYISWVVDHIIVYTYTPKSFSLLWLLTWNVMSCTLVLHDTLAPMRLQIFTPAYIIKCQNRENQAFHCFLCPIIYTFVMIF